MNDFLQAIELALKEEVRKRSLDLCKRVQDRDVYIHGVGENSGNLQAIEIIKKIAAGFIGDDF